MPEKTIPPQYIDPINGELMIKPVKINACEHIFDISTIGGILSANLGSKPNEKVQTGCPCCRGPIDRIEYLKDLKAEIEQFKKQNEAILDSNPNAVSRTKLKA